MDLSALHSHPNLAQPRPAQSRPPLSTLTHALGDVPLAFARLIITVYEIAPCMYVRYTTMGRANVQLENLKQEGPVVPGFVYTNQNQA